MTKGQASRDLYNAIMDGDFARFETLAAHTHPGELTEREGWTYLHRVLLITGESPSPLMIERLLGWGVDVNARDIYQSIALHYAVRQTTSEAPEIVRLLLGAGSDVNALNRDGRSPLRELIVSNPKNVAAARYLLDAGADPNQKKQGGKSVREMVAMNPSSSAELRKLFAIDA